MSCQSHWTSVMVYDTFLQFGRFISHSFHIRFEQRLNAWFYKPYSRMMIDHPFMAEKQPFRHVTECSSSTPSPLTSLVALLWSKSRSRTMLGLSLMVYHFFNMVMTGLSIHASTHHILREQITICTCLRQSIFRPFVAQNFNTSLKWKPPSENSIDFKLVLRFPPSINDPNQPDLHAKPLFLLHAWLGGERGQERYELYDEMFVEDEEWEK